MTFLSEFKTAAWRAFRQAATMLVVGVAAIAIVSFLSDDPLTMFFRLVAYASVAAVVLSCVVMVLTFRATRVLQPAALAVAAATTVACAAISALLAKEAPGAGLAAAALVFGCAVGVGWSFTSLLYVDESLVRMRGTLWHLLIWAGFFAASQIAGRYSGGASHIAMAAMIASAGLSIGNTLGLISRAQGARRAAAMLSDESL
jgi:hypothetical protein